MENTREELLAMAQAQSATVRSNPSLQAENGLIEKGNIDLNTRPTVHNEDGSISTVRSMSVNFDGVEVLIPTVSDAGAVLDDESAIDLYLQTGKHLGKFNSSDAATAYADKLHNSQSGMYAPDPTRDTATYTMVRGDDTYNDAYYANNTEDYLRANEPMGDGIVGTLLNPIVAPANNVGRQFMYGGNIGVNIGKEIYRKVTHGPADPAWNDSAITEWLDKNKAQIDPEQAWRYYGTNNVAEAMQMKAHADEQTRAAKVNSMRGGFENFAAGALAGLIDIDTPLMFMSGGIGAAAKLGMNQSRAGRLLAGTASGAGMGLALGTIDYSVNPDSDPESVALMAIMGGGFGMMAGGLSRAPVDALATTRAEAVEELGRQMHYGARRERTEPDAPPVPPERPMPEAPTAKPEGEEAAPTGREPGSFDPEQVMHDDHSDAYDPLTMTGGGSIGARQMPGAVQYDGVGRKGLTGESLKRYDEDLQWQRNSQGVRDYQDPDRLESEIGEYMADKVRRFRDYANRIGVGTDFDTLMRSNLPGAQRLAMDLLESASGLGRQQTNAAIIAETYKRDLTQAYRPIQLYEKEFFTQEKGWKTYDYLRQQVGGGVYAAKDEFHREIIKEQMKRRFKGGEGTSSPAAKKAADALENFYKLEYEIGRGRDGQKAIDGYDLFDREAGYVRQQWSGRKMAEDIDNVGKQGGDMGARKEMFVDALEEEYYRLYGQDFLNAQIKRADEAALKSGTPPRDINELAIEAKKMQRVFASAVIDRALASRRGFQHDLIGLLRGDEADYIRDALKRNGVPDYEIKNVIDSIIGSREQKTRMGNTKQRTDVDFRRVASNGIALFDMLETDIQMMAALSVNRTAGLAGMARMGIGSKVEFEARKKAILDSQDARGKKVARTDRTMGDRVDDFVDQDPEITPELLDAIYGYFSGQRPGAGTAADATIQRIKKLTRLSLMNQLGLTSLAEHGAIAGTVGWGRWMDHVGQDIMRTWRGKESALQKELDHFAFFQNEETLFNGRLMYELERAESGDLLAKLDSVLNKGLEIQGYLSGYHSVVSMQQRVAISSLTARIFEAEKTGKGGLSAQRMKDLGIDDAMMQRWMDEAEFKDGRLIKLNMDKWHPDDVEAFQQRMTRGVHQLVQKAMAGESNWAFQSNGLAQLFMQFKSFPLLAIHKQFTRNMQMADLETINTFMFGLVTAGMAYSLRQVVNANTANLTADKIARGALNYSNMTGWLPMFVDPVLSMVGADVNMSGYSSYGAGSMISLPASYNVLEKLMAVPGAMGTLMMPGAEMKNSDWRTLQSIPLLGNAYGINALLNMMKDPPRQKRAQPEQSSTPAPEEQEPTQILGQVPPRRADGTQPGWLDIPGVSDAL